MGGLIEDKTLEQEDAAYRRLSLRLRALYHMVPEGRAVCDVGTDHGFLPVALISTRRVPHVLAMDLREGPLSRAREHVWEDGVEEDVSLRLSDGLEKFHPGEAETVIIAGMGGALMEHILEDTLSEKAKAGIRTFILQPQSEIMHMRKFLAEKNYRIVEEDMVYEDGKYYPMMKVVPADSDTAGSDSALSTGDSDVDFNQELALRFGPVLLAKKHPVLKKYLQHGVEVEKQIIEKIEAAEPSEQNAKKLEKLKTELAYKEQALSLM